MEALYRVYLQHPSVQTDTRKLQPGDLFFALKGPNFNGNTYARHALELGASYCICDEDPGFEDERVIMVSNTLDTLQNLSRHHREQLKIPVIAITGSNGKTTTKELIHEVLSAKYKTYTTVGNLNNHIGVPLTLLSIKQDAEMAVVEMGANHQKEIASYCIYTQPTHGLITNCGKAHLEGFGSEEGVRKGKGELFDYLREHKGTAFINIDLGYLREMSHHIQHLETYGSADAQITGSIVNRDGMLQVSIQNDPELSLIKTNLVGDYNFANVLAAVAVGKYFDVSSQLIKKALEDYHPTNSRSQLIEKNGNKIVLDAYNANPSSMKAAIENFARMPGGNKILLLGGMMELGADSRAEHEAIQDLISNYEWETVVLVGSGYIPRHEAGIHFTESGEALTWLEGQHLENKQILIKGSRGMQMEKLLAAL